MKAKRGGTRSETTAVTRERVLDVALRRLRRLDRPARIAFRLLADRVSECMDEGLVHAGASE